MLKLKHFTIGVLTGILQYCILAVSSYWILISTVDSGQLSPWVYVAICLLIGITVLCYLLSTDTLFALLIRILWNVIGLVGSWLFAETILLEKWPLKANISTDFFMFESMHVLAVMLVAGITIVVKIILILCDKDSRIISNEEPTKK